MTNLHDVLELCLQELENGADLETLLARYPDLVDELHPLLTTAVHARQMAVSAPSDEVVRRNRAKLLQHAAQAREQLQTTQKKSVAFQRSWATALLGLAMLLLFSAWNVVSASAQAIPGDGLYPVKRWWEQVRLTYTFNASQRDQLASAIEAERLAEIEQLFAQNISMPVDFVGEVTSARPGGWQIAGIMVFVSNQTELPDGPIQIGLTVQVYGTTRGQVVLAEHIEILSGGAPVIVLPTVTPTPTTAETEVIVVTVTPTPTGTPTVTPTVTPPVAPGNTNGNTNGNENDNDNESSNSNSNDNGGSDHSGSNNNGDDSNNNNSNDDD